MPRVALPYLVAAGAVEPGAQDPSSAPYVDFFCEYRSAYQLNASAAVRYAKRALHNLLKSRSIPTKETY